MKITFFSNFLNHHQLPFCIEIKKYPNVDFKFVATQKIPEERIKLGYEDMNSKYDFVVEAYKNQQEAETLAKESDIVIIGEAPNYYLKLRKNKVSFRYSERIFKSKFSLKSLVGMYIRNYKYNTTNNYLLCASAYAASDYNKFNFFVKRSFKWGYFPKIKKYVNIDELLEKKDDNLILWVGRFIKWKHPEIMIDVAKYIKNNNLTYKINMIGEGPLKDNIRNSIKKEGLENIIKIYDSMSPQEVRKNMEMAKIFLFTSDRHEGWGAVLNESMNSACLVIANEMIGAVPYIVKNEYNGFTYRNVNEIYHIISCISLNKYDTNVIGKKAYESMVNYWCPEEAAKRFLKLSKVILEKQNYYCIFEDGPLSLECKKRR